MSKGPLSNLLLVKPITEEKNSGLYVQGEKKEKPSKGEVVEVGPDVKSDIDVEDVVLFGTNAGSETYIEGVKYLIMREPEIYYNLGKKVC